MTQEWKVGDWVVFDLSIGQVKELRDGGMSSFTDGFFETSGRLAERFRPLTLNSKRVVETFDAYYKRMREIDGEGGFNYPRIHQHFCGLALRAIDAPEINEPYELAQAFVRDARNYKTEIQGVRLFRPK